MGKYESPYWNNRCGCREKRKKNVSSCSCNKRSYQYSKYDYFTEEENISEPFVKEQTAYGRFDNQYKDKDKRYAPSYCNCSSCQRRRRNRNQYICHCRRI